MILVQSLTPKDTLFIIMLMTCSWLITENLYDVTSSYVTTYFSFRKILCIQSSYAFREKEHISKQILKY